LPVARSNEQLGDISLTHWRAIIDFVQEVGVAQYSSASHHTYVEDFRAENEMPTLTVLIHIFKIS
jgi:hypothetical protein